MKGWPRNYSRGFRGSRYLTVCFSWARLLSAVVLSFATEENWAEGRSLRPILVECLVRRLDRASLLFRGSISLIANDRDVDSECGGEVDLVILFVDEDFADLLGHGVLAQGFTLPDAVAIVANGFAFVVQLEVQHFLGVVGSLHGFRCDAGHSTEIVDLAGDGKGVFEFLLGVNLKLIGDVHVRGALKNLRIHDIPDDGLVFA